MRPAPPAEGHIAPIALRVLDTVRDLAPDEFGLHTVDAANAAAGMARGRAHVQAQAQASKPLIAVSMFGVTTPGVMRIRGRLEAEGFEVVTFHAVGEGAGMEHLIDHGAIDGLIDYTLPEIINRWNGGIFDPGCDRMEAAVRTGSIEEIVLAAPGHVLHDIREHLDKEATAKLGKSLSKDLTNIPEHELASHFA